MRHGAAIAYELLGADYNGLMASWFERGCYVEQGPEYFLCYSLNGETGTVEFAAGDLRAIRRAARGAMAAHGVRRVRWCRAWAGKHEAYHEWDIERIAGHDERTETARD